MTMYVYHVHDSNSYSIYQSVVAQPTFVRALCESILEDNVAFNVSISRLSAHNMIALTGFLLEYPIAYYPEEEQVAFLANVPLDVFECKLSPKHCNSERYQVIFIISK